MFSSQNVCSKHEEDRYLDIDSPLKVNEARYSYLVFKEVFPASQLHVHFFFYFLFKNCAESAYELTATVKDSLELEQDPSSN